MTATDKLSHRFIEGLEKYNLTYEEIKDWKYAGGNKGRHYNYFVMICGDNAKPLPHTNNCVCNHYIEENCYIRNGNDFLILGNCCIKKFIPMNTRTCKYCNSPHRNRKNNICNGCRKKYKVRTDTLMPFGKYKGDKLSKFINNPSKERQKYILWMRNTFTDDCKYYYILEFILTELKYF